MKHALMLFFLPLPKRRVLYYLLHLMWLWRCPPLMLIYVTSSSMLSFWTSTLTWNFHCVQNMSLRTIVHVYYTLTLSLNLFKPPWGTPLTISPPQGQTRTTTGETWSLSSFMGKFLSWGNNTPSKSWSYKFCVHQLCHFIFVFDLSNLHCKNLFVYRYH